MLQPEFDRAAFFSYNKKAILRGLSHRGRDTSVGSKLFGGIERGGKGPALEVVLEATVFKPPPATASPEPSRQTVSSPIKIVPAIGDPSPISGKGVTAFDAKQVKCPSSADLSSLAPTMKAVTAVSDHLEERRERQLATIIDELDQWCLDGSKGSRSAHLAKMTEASVSSRHT